MLVIVDDNTDTVSLCGLEWGDVLFINALLIKEGALTKKPAIRIRADRLLTAFESAAENIIESTADYE